MRKFLCPLKASKLNNLPFISSDLFEAYQKCKNSKEVVQVQMDFMKQQESNDSDSNDEKNDIDYPPESDDSLEDECEVEDDK
jgi:hypothetical protein